MQHVKETNTRKIKSNIDKYGTNILIIFGCIWRDNINRRHNYAL